MSIFDVPLSLKTSLKIPGTTRQEGRTDIGFGRWSQVKHLNFWEGWWVFVGYLKALLFERRFKRCVCVKIRSTTSNLRGFNRYTLGCFVEWTWRIYKLNSYNIWLKKCWRILLTNDGFQACNGTVIQRFSEYMLNHFDFENHEKNMGKASWAKPHRSHIFRPVPVQQCGTYSLAPSCRRCNPNRL